MRTLTDVPRYALRTEGHFPRDHCILQVQRAGWKVCLCWKGAAGCRSSGEVPEVNPRGGLLRGGGCKSGGWPAGSSARGARPAAGPGSSTGGPKPGKAQRAAGRERGGAVIAWGWVGQRRAGAWPAAWRGRGRRRAGRDGGVAGGGRGGAGRRLGPPGQHAAALPRQHVSVPVPVPRLRPLARSFPPSPQRWPSRLPLGLSWILSGPCYSSRAPLRKPRLAILCGGAGGRGGLDPSLAPAAVSGVRTGAGAGECDGRRAAAKGAGAAGGPGRAAGGWRRPGPGVCVWVSAGVWGEMASPPPAALGAGMAGKAASHCSRAFEGLGGGGESGSWRTPGARLRDSFLGREPLAPAPPRRGPSLPAAPSRRRKAWNAGDFSALGPWRPGGCVSALGAGRGRSVPGAPSPPGCWRRGAGRRSWAPGFPRGRGEDPGVRTCRECRPPEELGGGVSAAASKSPGRPRRPRGEGGLGVFLPGASGFESCRWRRDLGDPVWSGSPRPGCQDKFPPSPVAPPLIPEVLFVQTGHPFWGSFPLLARQGHSPS